MSFDFVLVSFATAGAPPDTRTLKEWRQDYVFAPLSERGPIYTIDLELWSKPPRGSESRGGSFCPGRAEISRALERAERDDCYFLLGLTQEQLYFPPGSEDSGLKLESALDLFQKQERPHLVDLGYDVIDQWTGLSALGNIGYSTAEFDSLRQLQLATTPYNLLETHEHALAFARFAAAAAEEHAPFIPLRVMARIPGHVQQSSRN
jgi:hypothetical protein